MAVVYKRKLLRVIAGVVLVFILCYIFGSVGRKDNSVVKRITPPMNAGNMARMMDFNMLDDGSVDLHLRLDLPKMMKLLNAVVDDSDVGNMFLPNPPPTDVNFLVDNQYVCAKAPELKVLVYAHSAVANTVRRTSLRQTWARRGLFKVDLVRLIFLMGRPKDDAERKIVREESEKFGDLVVGDFDDQYRNLTTKALMGLKWVSLFCKNVPYVMKIDDDTFVNIFDLPGILPKNEQNERTVKCLVWHEHTMPILRDPATCRKWCLKFNEFPGKRHFPRYCAGLAIIMNGNIVPEMYRIALKTEFFWIDDVFLTGMVGNKVPNIKFVDIRDTIELEHTKAMVDYLDENKKQVTHKFVHVKEPNVFYKMWNATLHKLDKEVLETLSVEAINEFPKLKEKLNM